MHGGFDAVPFQGEVVVHAVLRGDYSVVVAKQHYGRWSVGGHLLLVAVEVDLLLWGLLADEAVAAAFVGVFVVECHNEIEEDLEGWGGQRVAVGGNGCGEVSACR